MDGARRRLLQMGGVAVGISLAGCSTLSSVNPLSGTVDLTDGSREAKPTPAGPGVETKVEYERNKIWFDCNGTEGPTDPPVSRAVVHTGTTVSRATTLHEFDTDSGGDYIFRPYEWIENNDAIEDTAAYKDAFISRLPTIRLTVIYENGGFDVLEAVDTEALRENVWDLTGVFTVYRRGRNAPPEIERGEKFVRCRLLFAEGLTLSTANKTVELTRSEVGETGERVYFSPQDYYTDTDGDGVYDSRSPITVTLHQGEMSRTVLEETPSLYEIAPDYERSEERPTHYRVLFDETEQFTPFTVVSPEGEYLSERLSEWEIFENDYGDVMPSADPEGTGDPRSYTDSISGFGASITEAQIAEDGTFIPRVDLPEGERGLEKGDSFAATYAPWLEVHEDATHINVVGDLRGERYVLETVRFDES